MGKKGTADAEALVLLPADGVCWLRLVCSISLIPGAAFILTGLLPWGWRFLKTPRPSITNGAD